MALQVSEERGVRYLHFGSRWVQGAMRMSRPDQLELEYTRQMMFPLLLRDDAAWPRRALLIGLGAASLLKFLYRYRARSAITVVETRRDVVDVARQCFRLPDDPSRVTITLADGATYVAGRGTQFDLLMVDGYDGKGRVGALDSLRFYRDCAARMREGGIFVTNLLSRHRGLDASLARMRAAFDDRALALPLCASGNVVVLAACGAPIDMTGTALAERAALLRDATGLNLSPVVARLARGPLPVGACW